METNLAHSVCAPIGRASAKKKEISERQSFGFGTDRGSRLAQSINRLNLDLLLHFLLGRFGVAVRTTIKSEQRSHPNLPACWQRSGVGLGERSVEWRSPTALARARRGLRSTAWAGTP